MSVRITLRIPFHQAFPVLRRSKEKSRPISTPGSSGFPRIVVVTGGTASIYDKAPLKVTNLKTVHYWIVFQVVLLQLLLGSPLSLNLRNLIWHGFIGFQELDTHRYASVLLFVCAAIGRHLDRSITVNEIIPRRWATLKHLPSKWSEFLNEELLAEAVSTTRGLPASRKAIWHRAIVHHQRGRYGRCCLLIIPEIEHTLRLIYCATNNCPARALTAESVAHYTTLDVILECSNKMVDFLGDGLFSALLDVFVHVEGPRVRDRFSHGECLLLETDSNVSRHLLALSAALLGLAECVIYPNYSPYYSPAVVFHRQVMETMETVGDWLQLVSLVDHQPADLTGWPADCLPLLADWLQNWSLAVHLLLKDHLRENYRLSKGSSNPLAATWRRMMSQFVLGCQRMTVYRHTSSSLRSRQRSSHARLDSYTYLFVRAVRLSLLFPIAVCLGGEVVIDDPQTVRRVKRSVTRWADNFASAANNRWIELAQCATDVLQSIQPLPVVFTHR